MKKILSVALGAAAMAGLLASCSEDNFTDKYADPSKTSTVSVNQMFTGVMNAGNTWMNPMYFRYFTQSTTSGTFSGIIGTANGRGRFRGASEGYYNTRWMNFYNMVTQHRVLEENYNNLEPDQQEANKVFFLLSRTMVEAQLHEMCSLFGAVPFKEAGTLWKTGDYANAKPAYDSDVELYKMILADLKEVGDYLGGNVNGAGASALTRADFSDAHGNIDAWRRYTNSLRLRIALHLVNGDCAADAKAAIAEILGNPSKYPVIEENSQNFTVSGDISKDDYNFGKSFSQAIHTFGNSYGMVGQTVLDALKLQGGKYVAGTSDPRTEAMLDPNPDNEYVAYDVTLDDNAIDNISSAKTKEYAALGMTTAKYYACMDSVAIAGVQEYNGNNNTKGIWMSAAEVQLSKAEAYLMGYGVSADAAKAEAAFKAGVVASCEYYWNVKTNSSYYAAGNDCANTKDYTRPLEVPTTADFEAYAAAAWAPSQEVICTQLWLNHFVWNELEAWNVTRRTGFPAVKFAKDARQTNYPTPPHRLPYPSDELNYNGDNCQAAIAKYYTGGNAETAGYYSKLFWAKDNYYSIVAEK